MGERVKPHVEKYTHNSDPQLLLIRELADSNYVFDPDSSPPVITIEVAAEIMGLKIKAHDRATPSKIRGYIADLGSKCFEPISETNKSSVNSWIINPKEIAEILPSDSYDPAHKFGKVDLRHPCGQRVRFGKTHIPGTVQAKSIIKATSYPNFFYQTVTVKNQEVTTDYPKLTFPPRIIDAVNQKPPVLPQTKK